MTGWWCCAGLCAADRVAAGLYNNPVNLFVAGFIGSPSMNFIPGRLGTDAIDTPIGKGHAARPQSGRGGCEGRWRRADRYPPGEPGGRRAHRFRNPICRRNFHRRHRRAGIDGVGQVRLFRSRSPGCLHADAASVGARQFVARLSPESQATRGSRTELFYDTRKISVFDQSSGANLRL